MATGSRLCIPEIRTTSLIVIDCIHNVFTSCSVSEIMNHVSDVSDAETIISENYF